MRKLIWVLVAVAIAMAVASVAHAAQPARDSLLVDTAGLAARLNAPETVVLHVGDAASFAAGHIPGARPVPQGGLAAARNADNPAALYLELPDAETLRQQLQQLGIAPTSRIVVAFAREDSFPAATRVLYTLDAAGFGDRVALLDGGLPAWQKEGRPVTTDAPTVTPSVLPPLQLKPRSAELAALWPAAPTLIDARAPPFYSGKETGRLQSTARAGHLPGARNVPFSSVLTDGKLKSRDELTKLFRDAKVKPGERVVVYCHIGQQASAVQFAARLAGVDALVYDGSFQEWAQKGLPLRVGEAP
jgi:thiosulfate/3-mercaptopyruvate sulfurtransferase